MQVNYTLRGVPHSLEIEDRDDLKGLLLLTDEAIRACHTEAKENPMLLSLITDGVLNSLADDLGEITLGDIVPSNH